MVVLRRTAQDPVFRPDCNGELLLVRTTMSIINDIAKRICPVKPLLRSIGKAAILPKRHGTVFRPAAGGESKLQRIVFHVPRLEATVQGIPFLHRRPHAERLWRIIDRQDIQRRLSLDRDMPITDHERDRHLLPRKILGRLKGICFVSVVGDRSMLRIDHDTGHAERIAIDILRLRQELTRAERHRRILHRGAQIHLSDRRCIVDALDRYRYGGGSRRGRSIVVHRFHRHLQLEIFVKVCRRRHGEPIQLLLRQSPRAVAIVHTGRKPGAIGQPGNRDITQSFRTVVVPQGCRDVQGNGRIFLTLSRDHLDVRRIRHAANPHRHFHRRARLVPFPLQRLHRHAQREVLVTVRRRQHPEP